ncbi:hypothetical protein ACFQ1I_21430 [Kitasatospora arboriphila]
MAKQTTGKMTKLRRGTQELLERRGMATNPGPLAPQLHADTASAARNGPYFGDAVFSHGGRRSDTTAGPMAASPTTSSCRATGTAARRSTPRTETASARARPRPADADGARPCAPVRKSGPVPPPGGRPRRGGAPHVRQPPAADP